MQQLKTRETILTLLHKKNQRQILSQCRASMNWKTRRSKNCSTGHHLWTSTSIGSSGKSLAPRRRRKLQHVWKFCCTIIKFHIKNDNALALNLNASTSQTRSTWRFRSVRCNFLRHRECTCLWRRRALNIRHFFNDDWRSASMLCICLFVISLQWTGWSSRWHPMIRSVCWLTVPIKSPRCRRLSWARSSTARIEPTAPRLPSLPSSLLFAAPVCLFACQNILLIKSSSCCLRN